jgi:nitrogen fixation NifU-like protein
VKDLTRLYRDAIKRHATNPIGFCLEIDATNRYEADNPLCGDRILLSLRIVDGQLEAAAFEGEACAICMASASILCATVPGHPAQFLHERHGELLGALQGKGELNERDSLAPLLGVKAYPSRIDCATLPWSAAVRAIR